MRNPPKCQLNSVDIEFTGGRRCRTLGGVKSALVPTVIGGEPKITEVTELINGQRLEVGKCVQNDRRVA